MSKRALVVVLDSVGCGGAPDAEAYGDAGTDTIGHLYEGITGFRLPNLESIGLASIIDLAGEKVSSDRVSAFRLTEHSAGKDTTTGHWELMGCPIEEAFFTCSEFPADFLVSLENASGTRFIGNKIASGTDILRELGGEHLRTGHAILYTSADSVLQIAAHEESFGLERLYEVCKTARELLDQSGMKVGRVIARPFTGDESNGFQRTPNRHDYSLTPGETVLDRLIAKGVDVIGVGKISDIFAGKGITRSHSTKSNADGMAVISQLWNKRQSGDHVIFANLVDFDSLYGHRRDPEGYAQCLREFDVWLGNFLPTVGEEDLVIITADHGNDPYHTGTDHTREQVPCLVLGAKNFNCGEMSEFSDVADCLYRFF
ncbi:MAG: phosphopentomutase [Akkermansiaceae bacterium]|jgi:phosphopentomutase|nr:phosphopentomutase [Akkermansiaceae bacterium]MDP4779597.1 phosphopentomutase [Akkermansiaceae bacterium]MDP4846323.1 phosphopentomutase [Akkermansiaceae bacterium]MDP4896911.1 phosphopentomutase [Akkermansiaceae bacterium]MDP4996109.1 phosphopentomutase [Akkermansiaceae bacterium]